MRRVAHRAPDGARHIVDIRAASAGNRRDLAPSRVHLSFLRALHGEMLKLNSLKSTWIMVALALLLEPFGAFASAWSYKYLSTINPTTGKPLKTPAPIAMSDYWLSTGAGLSMAIIVVGVMGVLCISSEFTGSSITATLTSNPRRGTVLAAKAAYLAFLTWMTSQIGVLFSWAAVQLTLSAPGKTELEASQVSLPWLNLLGGPLFLAVFAVMALGIGAACRSTVGGVMTVLGLILIAPMLLSILRAVSRYFAWLDTLTSILPMDLLGLFLGGQTAPPSDVTGFLPLWWQAGLIMVVWAAVFYFLGTLIVKRVDIS